MPIRPRRFDFFAALRLFEAAHPEGPRLGKAARGREERLRLGQEPRLAFPTGSLAGYVPAAGGCHPKLAVLLFGLLGGSGPLPLHLTAHALDRRRQAGDATFIDFCDLLQHRLIALFYRAWADARPHVQHDRPGQDRFRLYVGALAGFGLPALLERDALPDRFRFHHAGLISCQTAHAERVEALVKDLLGVPAEVEELVGGWLDLPDALADPFGPGRHTAGRRRGGGDRQLPAAASLPYPSGSVDLADYEALLPGGERLRRLKALLRLLLGDAIEWDLALVLKARRGAAASAPRPCPPRLDDLACDGHARAARGRSGAATHARRGLRGQGMLGIRRDAVYTKLDPVPFRALESAFQLARTRGDAYVELAHWLNQILMQPDSDLHRIVAAFGIDHARLAADMSRTLERIRKGGSAMLDFSEHVDRAIERGWIVASLVFGAGRIRTGHLLLGLLDETELTRLLVAISEQFRKLDAERLGARPAADRRRVARGRGRHAAAGPDRLPVPRASCRRRPWARPRRCSASRRT